MSQAERVAISMIPVSQAEAIAREKIAEAEQATQRKPRAPRAYPLVSTIRAARQGLNRKMGSDVITTDVVAKHVGATKWMIENAERGGDVHVSLAIRIAAFYGLTLDQLWAPNPNFKDSEASAA